MIRMGRSNKTESATETAQSFQEQATNSSASYQFTGENIVNSSRGVSESESMARDIKEGRLSGYVGSGTVLTGETNFQAMLRVDGHLTGRIMSETGTLIVGISGQVDANVAVAAAVINGIVNGDIVATEKIQLGRTARVVGNIQSPRLVLEDGAILEGNCVMLKAREAVEKRANEVKSNSYAENTSYRTEEIIEAVEEMETAEAAVN
jgi:cytoskeletal protein CcmA (bactofilin family)